MTEASIPKTGGEGRWSRGLDLFRDAAIVRISKDPEVWEIETPYGSVNRIEVDRGTCSCADFEIHTYQRGIENFWCKHRTAVELKRRKLRKDARQLAGFFGGEAA